VSITCSKQCLYCCITGITLTGWFGGGSLINCCWPCHYDGVNRPAGTTLEQVLAVMDILRSLGCRFWLEGGWGAALVGRQTRPHRDVDIDFDGTFEEEVLAALLAMGYAIEMDWRPNRVELGARRVGDGSTCIRWCSTRRAMRGKQPSGGGWHVFPARSSPRGVSVTCRFRASRWMRSAFSIPATNHVHWIGTTWRSWIGSQRADAGTIARSWLPRPPPLTATS
jgi:lincosamide nucleotidyltransferase A/C/D/E